MFYSKKYFQRRFLCLWIKKLLSEDRLELIEPIARTIKRFVAAGIGTQIYLRTYRTYRTELIFLRCGGSDIAVSTVSVSEDRENTNA